MTTYWEYRDGLIYLVTKREYRCETRFEYEIMCPHCEILHNVFPFEAREWLTEHAATCPSRPRDGDPDEVDQWAIRRFLTHTFGYRRTRKLPPDVYNSQLAALEQRLASTDAALEDAAKIVRQKNPDAHELATQRAP